MKIGDEVVVRGYVDEIRNDVVIIRNDGGYFGTEPDEVMSIVRCRDCKNYVGGKVAHDYDRCRHHWSEVGEDDFCSFGEREGE